MKLGKLMVNNNNIKGTGINEQRKIINNLFHGKQFLKFRSSIVLDLNIYKNSFIRFKITNVYAAPNNPYALIKT